RKKVGTAPVGSAQKNVGRTFDFKFNHCKNDPYDKATSIDDSLSSNDAGLSSIRFKEPNCDSRAADPGTLRSGSSPVRDEKQHSTWLTLLRLAPTLAFFLLSIYLRA